MVVSVRDTAAVVLGVVALLPVFSLADDALGLCRPVSMHGPRRSTCLQVFGCFKPASALKVLFEHDQ